MNALDINWHEVKAEGFPKENGHYVVRYIWNPPILIEGCDLHYFATNLHEAVPNSFDESKTHSGFYRLRDKYNAYCEDLTSDHVEVLAWAKIA